MVMNILTWSIFEITTTQKPIHGVMMRGRLRKKALESGFNLLTENASDIENCVRFAVLDVKDAHIISDYINSIVSDAQVLLVAHDVPNPVLSKLKVNKAERYNV